MSGDQREEKFGAGQVLFKQGEQSRDLYFIKKGQIELTVKDENSSASAVVAVLGDKSVLGSMSFLEGEPRSATATVKTDAVVIKVRDTQREKLLKGVPTWLQVLIKDLALNLRRSNFNYTKLKEEFLILEKRFQHLKAKSGDDDKKSEDPDKVLD